MKDNPKISVVMTVFNAEPFLKEAIDSILGQSFEDFEFIIIDNASADRSRNIIASYKDSRILFIENERNLGQSKALNIGIRKARGEFIARMDADDISLPRRFQEQYDYLQKNGSIAVVGSWYLEIDEKGRTIREFRLPTDPWEIKTYLIGSSALSYHCIPHPIVLMRKQALLDAGLYNEGYIVQDFDLWVRISRKYLLSNLGKVLFKYRINSSSQSMKLAGDFKKDCRSIIEENIKYFYPEINNKDFIMLSRMLEYRSQETCNNGDDIFKAFDDFLTMAFAEYKAYPQAKRAAEAMKLYYLPRIMYFNKWFCLRYAARTILSYPALITNKKIYAKFYTVMLEELLRGSKCQQ